MKKYFKNIHKNHLKIDLGYLNIFKKINKFNHKYNLLLDYILLKPRFK